MEYQIYYENNQLLLEDSENSPVSKNSWDLTPSDNNSMDNADFEWSELKIDEENTSSDVKNNTNQRKRKFVEIDGGAAVQNSEKVKMNTFSGLSKEIMVMNSRKDGLLKIPIQWQGDINDIHSDIIESSFNALDNNGFPQMGESSLAISGLTVFKQEAASPTHEVSTSRKTVKQNISSPTSTQEIERNNLDENSSDQLTSTISQLLNTSYSNLQNTFDTSLVASPSSQDQYNVSSTFGEDCRFQYVLAAATSIATKINEDTLTYLNQGQSYEIKLKKLGDLSMYRGKMLKSVIRICFHERRLQYMEKEQMMLWQKARPGDRILDVDIPLSYGAVDIVQPLNSINLIHFNWDPTKEIGVYIKVNCISTEFTPKKRGGEKGVPFRIQVETYPTSVGIEVPKRLHAAACQVKVFKLKGADRKHKQDREKIIKRPLSEQEKYQPSYECTVLNDIPNDAVLPCSLISPLSPVESDTSSNKSNSFPTNVVTPNNVLQETFSAVQQQQQLMVHVNLHENNREMKPSEYQMMMSQEIRVKPTSTVEEVANWLLQNRFRKYIEVFQNFNGHDMLRLSRNDILQICGEADGIRFFNVLHDKAITPRTKIYVSKPNTNIYHAIFLTTSTKDVLKDELCKLLGLNSINVHEMFIEGPNNIRVVVCNSVVHHIKEESAFTVNVAKNEDSCVILLKQNS